MRRRTWAAVAAIGILSLGVAAGAATMGKVKFYTGSGLNNLDFYGYTYNIVVDGYPPMPRNAIITGDDSEKIPQGYSGYKYECIVEASQHTPGESYPWRMVKYKDATKKELENYVWATGQATAY